jgi:integrase/recombinase XerD
MGQIVASDTTQSTQELACQDATGAELVAAYQATLQSKKSQQTATESLRRIARVIGTEDHLAVPWHTLQLETLGAIRSALAAQHAPATANLSLSVLRSLLHVAFVKGKITERQFAALKFLKRVKGSRIEKGHALTFDEERKLQKYVLSLPGYRATMLSAAISISIGAGLRREELCKLTLAAYDKREKALHVIGKGNKERLAYVDDVMRLELEGWLVSRKLLLVEHPALFCCPARVDRPLTAWTWWGAVRQAADAAGVRMSGPHDFRRTFATRLLDQQYDLRQVQQLMGHENIETTAAYDKRELEALRQKRLNTRIIATAVS